MRCTVSLCSVLRSWSHLRLYFVTGFYMTWLTWAHNSMLINYDPSDLLAVLVVLQHLKEKKLREARSSKQCCSAIQVLRSHHLNRSRTCARHWEQCRLLFLAALLPVSGDHKSLFLHVSLQSPQSPHFVPSPAKVVPRLHLNLEDWVQQKCCFNQY